MSTTDVPGARAVNRDELSMGCWAEHEDGSLIFVENTEGGRVIYSVFDVSKKPPMEYRDAMPEDGFKEHFSWDPNGKKSDDNLKWTWHDKTTFPWDRIIEEGMPDGVRHACANHLISAAKRVSKSRQLMGNPIDEKALDEMTDKVGRFGRASRAMIDGIQNALNELRV